MKALEVQVAIVRHSLLDETSATTRNIYEKWSSLGIMMDNIHILKPGAGVTIFIVFIVHN